jgi:demethylmenaquinone methyltransferase/2-methoxy-6-polyprenyl-1,4-benzoquinol methylase
VRDDDLLMEQRAFYRARAPEYDDWWQRRGRYDRGEAAEREWSAEVGVVEQALATFGPIGNVLELAGGTGWWTARLARTADRLTVVDAAPETLAINRRRVGRDDVEYQVADLFDWRPPHRYDVVFFSFWLSHVPPDRFGWFWDLVGCCLSPAGRVFFVDNRDDPTSRARDPFVVEYGESVQVRRLSDGSRYRVVKVHYEPGQLARLLGAAGWRSEVGATRSFIFGSAEPSAAPN